MGSAHKDKKGKNRKKGTEKASQPQAGTGLASQLSDYTSSSSGA
jgi:hypothetical protein